MPLHFFSFGKTIGMNDKNSLPEELHPFIGDLPDRKVKRLGRLWAASDPLPNWKTVKNERVLLNPWADGDPQAVGDGARYLEWLLHQLRTYPSDLQRAFIRAVIVDAEKDRNAASYDDIIEVLEEYLRGGIGTKKVSELKTMIGEVLEELQKNHPDKWPLGKYDKSAIARAIFRNFWGRGVLAWKSENQASTPFYEAAKACGLDEAKPDTMTRAGGVRYDEWKKKIDEIRPFEK
jgi:hypothetical protein